MMDTDYLYRLEQTHFMDYRSLLDKAIIAAESASREILKVYDSGDFETELKGDQSPLTLADRRAHAAIAEALLPSGLPMLSEEGRTISYEERKKWSVFWMVDPLDGTKEFVKRNGEFTVNIAVIHNMKPVLGVVAVPVTGDVYFASSGQGAYVRRNGETKRLGQSSASQNSKSVRVVASRSHLNAETKAFIDRLSQPVLVSQGSSLKFMMVAEGAADIYPRFAPTMEWDTAAAHAIVNEAGYGVFHTGSQQELSYNKPELINPFFVCRRY
jgi:3'(2'), 5'-bisphosphate nucleotidase